VSVREQSLEARRLELVQRSAAQRAALAVHAGPLRRKVEAFDRIAARVRRYPVVTALGVGVVALLGTRRIVELATRALTIYALFRR
jgi:hypothetical protein